jgi:curli biogenesis system outer membrane secretion channel CsgG
MCTHTRGRRGDHGSVSWVLVLLSLWALSSIQVCGQSPAKKKVAVFAFNNAAVQAGVSSPYLQTDTPDLGKGVAELLVSKLVEGGKVTVIERTAIDKLLSEQNLTNTDRADPETAARLGRVLGVDAIILGTITQYQYAETMKGYVGNRRGKRGSAPSGAKYDVTAKVHISTRLVDPDTSEVVAVSAGIGETDRKGVIMDVRDTSGRVMQAVGLNNPVVNESIDKAITQLAAQIEPALGNLAAHAAIIDGLVADVGDSGRLVLNVGAQQGVKVGDRLQVLRVGKEVRDPANGKLLTRNDTVLGDAVVTAVHDISSIAQYLGTEPPKIRDLVKSVPRKP